LQKSSIKKTTTFESIDNRHKSDVGGHFMSEGKLYTVFVNSSESEVRCESKHMIITDKRREGNKITIHAGDLERADWMSLNKLGTVHLFTRKGFYSFAGFRHPEGETFLDYLQSSLGVRVTMTQASCRGHNSGSIELHEKSFSISTDGFPVFRIPYGRINQVQSTSATDLVLNFIPDPSGESLSVLRLCVHERAPKAAKQLLADFSSFTDLTQGTEDYFYQLNEVSFLSPRQHFTVRFCRDLLFVSNESAGHRIAYDSISMVHRVDSPSTGETDIHEEFIVISLRQPIRQGQSTYSHLVVKTSQDDPVEGEGIEHQDWPLSAQLWHFFGAVHVRTIDQTGFFEGLQGETGIYCTYKGKPGFLYLTPDAFLYLSSPVLYIQYTQVTALEFGRLTSDTSRYSRAFDLTVHERTKKSIFGNVDLIAGLHIGIASGVDEREQMETAKREKIFQALGDLVGFLERKNLPIDKLKQVKKILRTVEKVSETGTRASKIDAQQKTREELRGLGSGESDEEGESDGDFNPEAARVASDAESGGDDGEGEGDDDEGDQRADDGDDN
jgi:hypothetical protein